MKKTGKRSVGEADSNNIHNYGGETSLISWLSYVSVRRALARHPISTRDEIVAFQNNHLRSLITHAYNNVPYYRRLFDRSGIKADDIRSLEELSAIPMTSKRDLQVHSPKEFMSQGVSTEHLIVRQTTGSTGEPFSIRRTRLEESLLIAFLKRALGYYGLKIKDKHADIEEIQLKNIYYSKLLQRMFNALGMYRQLKVHALLTFDEILDALCKFRPAVITGYAGVLARVAEVISHDDRRIIQPKFIATHSEVLTPLMRKQITEAFGSRVFNIYDSNEFNLIAWECKETGELHSCDDSLILEVLHDSRPAAPGERGEVVCTSLHSFAMPLIRYRLGDIVTKGSETCRCGQPFSTIRSVQGRMFDYFLLPGGRMIHPYEILALLGDKGSWIRQYQLIQEREDKVVLRVVPSSLPSKNQLEIVQEDVAKLLGRGVNFHVILVDEIPFEPSAKFRVCRSLVRSDYDRINWSDQ